MQLMRNLYLGGDQHTLRQKIIEAKLAIEYTKHHSKHSILTELPEQRPLRHRRRPDRDRRAGRGARSSSTSPSRSSTSSSPRCSPACRRRPPNTTRSLIPPRRANGATRCSRRWPNCTTSAAAASRGRRAPRRSRCTAATTTPQRSETFFFEYVRQQLIERYGAKHRRTGRAEGVHDDRPQHAAPGAQSDRRSARRARRPRLGDRHARPRTTATSRRWPSPRATSSPSTTSPPTATASPARPSRRSTSPTRSPAASTRTPPTTSRTRSSRAGCPAIPTYEVKTFEGTSLNKPINLVQATLTSDNTVYAQLAADLGEETITQMAYKMGVKTHLSSYPAEALGGLTLGVTPLEMAVVYATLADGGWRNTPIAITKVVFPDGHVDDSWGQPHRVKVLSEAVTAEETQILARQRARAAPRRARRSTARRPPRPAPPANSSTPGSTATPPTTRRSCGWATPTSASR